MTLEDLLMANVKQPSFGFSVFGPHFLPKRMLQLFAVSAQVCHRLNVSVSESWGRLHRGGSLTHCSAVDCRLGTARPLTPAPCRACQGRLTRCRRWPTTAWCASRRPARPSSRPAGRACSSCCAPSWSSSAPSSHRALQRQPLQQQALCRSQLHESPVLEPLWGASQQQVRGCQAGMLCRLPAALQMQLHSGPRQDRLLPVLQPSRQPGLGLQVHRQALLRSISVQGSVQTSRGAHCSTLSTC